MNLDTLKTELAEPAYAGLSDVAAADALNAETVTEVYSRFASFRTLAGVLDDAEYATAKTVLFALAEQSQKAADILTMLAMPGDDSGNGGGIDFGCPAVRGMIDQLVAGEQFTADLGTKLKGLAERKISRAAELGLGVVTPGLVEEARRNG